MPAPDPSEHSAATPSSGRDPIAAAESPPTPAALDSERVDRGTLKRLMRARGWTPQALAALSEVRARWIFRAMHDGEATRSVVERIAAVLEVPPDALLAKDEQVVLDGEKVRGLMHARSFREIEAASGKKLSRAGVGRARNGQPISRGLAQHLAQALHVRLDELIKKEAP